MPLSRRINCGVQFLVGLLLTMQLAQSVVAQNTGKARTLAHMPPDTVAVVSLWPKQLFGHDSMQLAPLEVFTATGVEQIGFDPLQIERLDVMIGFPGPRGPEIGGLFQLAEPLDIETLNPNLLDGQGLQTDGELSYLGMSESEFAIYQINPTTVAVGTKIFVRRMAQGVDEVGRVAGLVDQVQSEQDALAIVSISTLRPMIEGLLDRPMRDLPPPVARDAATIIEATDFAALAISMDDEERIQLVLAGANDADTGKIEQALGRSLEFFQQVFVQEFKGQFTADTPTGIASKQYIDRLSTAIVGMLIPKRKGTALVLQFENINSMGVIGTLTGLLLPAVQSARQAARRMQSSNNLKQLALALLNFESTFKAFPATAGLDDDGQPMISWRVAILPFIEEAALYNKFRLDEPWDSEHNIKLLEEMPETFRHPDRNTPPGHTVYQAAVSDKSLLRLKEPSRLQDITDGTSNTIMVVETSEEIAVPWTAPEDYEIDDDKPGANLFTKGITQAVFGDGAVRTLAESIDVEVLKALFTRAGGERVPNF